MELSKQQGKALSIRVLFLYANQPIALSTRKMELLNEQPAYDVRLVYWDRRSSSMSYPFSTNLSAGQIEQISLADGRSSYYTKMARRVSVVLKMAFRAIRLKPKIVHAFSFDVLLAALLAKLVSRGKIRVVYDIEDTCDWMIQEPGITIQRMLFPFVDQYFVTSRLYDDAFIQKYNLNRNRTPVTFIPNSPPAELFKSFVPRGMDGRIVVSYIGTFRAPSAITSLVRAVSIAREEGVNVEILFAGTGPELALVERLVTDNNYVTYSGPFDYMKDIVHIYAKSSVIFACYDDSYNKRIHIACRFAEAIVCGLPVIVAEGTYMADLTRRFGVGFVVRLGDVPALVDVFRCLQENPGEYARIRNNAKAIRSDYVLTTYELAYLKVYDRISACRRDV